MLAYWALSFACGTLLVAFALVVMRALLGPTVYDRILAMNALGTKTVILIAILGFIARRGAFLDIALLYTLINFVVTIAILKYRHVGSLG